MSEGNAQSTSTQSTSAPSWRPLPALQRRVFGVLVEKAKTTPDAYPLSLNALKNGCNQKSNRDPVMDLDEDQVQEALDALRELGAVAEVQGGARVPKYRHYAREWLGVDKTEIAVVIELLLRGPQTVGELRGRAARMSPIADLSALKPVLESLEAKGLLVSLTPPGRGQVVTHGLYPPEELSRLRADYEGGRAAPPVALPAERSASPASARAAGGDDRDERTREEITALRQEMAEIREQLLELREEVKQARDRFERQLDELNRFKDEIGG